ncbi:hypothetical protein ACFLUJ_08895 [Chloroflexota bacterium]
MSATADSWCKWLRRSGLILTLLLGTFTGWVLYVYLAWARGVDAEVSSIEQFILVVPALIIIISVAIAWKWPLVGGILLITESLLLYGSVAIAWKWPFNGGILLIVEGFLVTGSLRFIAVPILVSGLGSLFLVPWWIEHRGR